MISDLLGLIGRLVLVLWLATAIFWAVAGAALASWLRRPIWLGLLLGAALPVVGPLGLLIAGLVRRARSGSHAPHGREPVPVPYRATAAGTAVVLAVALWWVTGRPDTEAGIGANHTIDLAVRDLGLWTATFGTVLVLLAAAAASWFWRSRWPAVMVAWCAAWWLVWSLGVLNVGGTLETLLRTAKVSGVAPAHVRVGASWWLVAALAVLLLVWSGSALFTVHRQHALGGTAVGVAPILPGIGLPSAQPGFGLPTAQTGFGLPSPRPGLGQPTAQPGTGLPAGEPVRPPADPFSSGW